MTAERLGRFGSALFECGLVGCVWFLFGMLGFLVVGKQTYPPDWYAWFILPPAALATAGVTVEMVAWWLRRS